MQTSSSPLAICLQIAAAVVLKIASKMADYNASASSSINQNLSSSSDESDVEITSEEPAVTSLLQKLKAPKQSELCRKRKIQCNPPTGKKKIFRSTWVEGTKS